jgi:crotonobetainyl-CoA:carnitine CoA-transferase CaiB-like acyl-CoA transferase
MTPIMQGVRILEVAEHTFVPAASAVLADYGAEVIKIEHVERGDAMRGLASSGIAAITSGNVHVLLEHSNRGKQSLGLDLTTDEGIDILYKLAATCDVFLTNKLPSVRTKLKIGLDEIRAHNPQIIYASGTGQGERGPEADRGSYDSLAYWCRAGVAMGLKQPDDDPQPPPAPAFGDSIGAFTIAGGIMGALFHREKTGEATTVDVSLLSVGMWSMGAAIALSLQLNMPWAPFPPGTSIGNPLVTNYVTKDGRFLSFSCLQAFRYWAELCTIVGRPELGTDVRFADADALRENAAAGMEIMREVFAQRTIEEWRATLADFSGQWVVIQDTLEAVADVQAVANGYVGECETAGGDPFQLVAAPVQYGGEAAPPKRAPEFNEHGDDILTGLGLDWDTIVDLKVRGVVA